jgi:AcrR family transcriptional regulator
VNLTNRLVGFILEKKRDRLVGFKMKKSEEAKSRILAAAMAVLERDGLRTLTLDRVAQEAQVSKGGLTHHFKSKQELALGMLDALILQMKTRLEEFQGEEAPGTPGRFTRAYLKANLECIQSGEIASLRGLIEMLLVDPQLVQLRRHELLAMHGQLEQDGLDRIQALSIAAASDGCWMNVVFGFYDPQDQLIELMHEYLFELTRPKGQGRKGKS